MTNRAGLSLQEAEDQASGSAQERGGDGFHIVAAITSESQLSHFLALGCALASQRNGCLTVLHVSEDGLQPEWLAVPDRCGAVPVKVVVEAGDDPAGQVLSTVRKDPPDLLLLGWRGRPGRGRYLLGRNLDRLVQDAPCDVAILRAGADSPLPEGISEGIERVLVPMGGGPNAPLALNLALSLSPQVKVTALNIARMVQGQVALSLARERLQEMLGPWSSEARVEGKVVQSASIIKGILTEAARGYDLVMVGASHESYLDRVLFGNVPQTVVARSPVAAAVVRRRIGRMAVGTWLRRTGWRLFGVLPTLELREQTEVYKSVREGAEPEVDFFVMMALSAAIATFGLLQNSPAVIIGAMLVALLMAAIFGLSLGIVRGDVRLLRRVASATLRGGALPSPLASC